MCVGVCGDVVLKCIVGVVFDDDGMVVFVGVVFDLEGGCFIMVGFV